MINSTEKLKLALLAIGLAGLSAVTASAAVTGPQAGDDKLKLSALKTVDYYQTSEPATIPAAALPRLNPRVFIEAAVELTDNTLGWLIPGPAANPGESKLSREAGRILNAPHESPLMELLKSRPNIASLGGPPDGRSGKPLGDLSYLSLTPSGFAMMRSGLPTGKAERWDHTVETSLSYVRPHRNLQLALNFRGPQENLAALSRDLVGVDSEFVDDRQVQADTGNLAQRSSAFGAMSRARETEHTAAGRVVTIGFDMGLLPAVLSEVGLSSAIVIGESENPGPYISLVTTVAVPSDRPPERPRRNDYQVQIETLPENYSSGQVDFSAGAPISDNVEQLATILGGTSSTSGKHIIYDLSPDGPVPEPATLTLLAGGLAWLASRRRRTQA